MICASWFLRGMPLFPGRAIPEGLPLAKGGGEKEVDFSLWGYQYLQGAENGPGRPGFRL
jgi:hypothetical protein